MAYQKKSAEDNRSRWRKGIRSGFDSSGGVVCKGCFEKKLAIDDLRDENRRLKEKIKRMEKVAEREPTAKPERIIKKQVEGSVHHPKTRVPFNFKKNSKSEHRAKKGGAKLGHKGSGRSSATDQDAVENAGNLLDYRSCPECGGELKRIGQRMRTIVEAQPLKAKRVLYRCQRLRCTGCTKVLQQHPKALPRALYGNRLLSQAAVMHYVHGVSIGRLLEIFGKEVTEGGLIQAFHRLGRHFEKALPLLIERYRESHVRHADETPWRTDGHSGFAWLFSAPELSYLEFTNTRSSRIPKRVFGDGTLGGYLVVDRYCAYNQLPVRLQYCFAHFLRDVQKVEYDFPNEKEVVQFASRIAPPITQAMKLKGACLSEAEYFKKAQQIKREIETELRRPYAHLGIKRVQQVFLKREDRLYHWVNDSRVPAENNVAERELRPTVIARKISFGSQSDAGAKTRSAIMSVLFTAKKRFRNKEPVEEWLKYALDRIAEKPETNIYHLLPPLLPDTIH